MYRKDNYYLFINTQKDRKYILEEQFIEIQIKDLKNEKVCTDNYQNLNTRN